MTVHEERDSEFERRTRTVLEESVARVDSRIRWRLAHARRAALMQEETRLHRSFWRSFGLLPVAGTAAAAALVAVMLWIDRPERSAPVGEGMQATLEDIDLFADGETLELIEGWERGFYEWAVAQAELSGEASG